MASDYRIAPAAEIKPITDIARDLDLSEEDIDVYGKTRAKIALSVLPRLAPQPDGKYIVVTSITPLPRGEGKTTTAIGLSMALNRLGHRATVCLRQPSLGPVFGIKGGATGSGLAQVIPTEEINLHLTGDAHAVALAHNLLASYTDNSLFHDNLLGIDPYSIEWPRVVDLNDRALRKIIIGLGGRDGGIPRESSFDIAEASEVMSILSLTTSLADLRERLARIVIGTTTSGKAITAEDLHCAGAMTALLKDALRPNLVQTIEHTPAFIHTDPFALSATANNSVLADQVALKLSDYVVTEAGFGSDLGMEKFFDIKCRYSGLKPNAIVLVTTIRALKMHGGIGPISSNKSLPEELLKENIAAVDQGCTNMVKHIENGLAFNVPVVVAINRYETDTDREIARVEQCARESGAEGAFVSDVWERGGSGAIALATAVTRACDKPSRLHLLYPNELPIKAKIERIAEKMYGADGVDYAPEAERKIKLYSDLGFDQLPICMAKTPLSLSHDPKLKGRPRKFRVPIRDVRIAAGAGYMQVICGDIRTMPALPKIPAGTQIDIDENGKVIGLI